MRNPMRFFLYKAMLFLSAYSGSICEVDSPNPNYGYLCSG